jgi:hypothetical protein
MHRRACLLALLVVAVLPLTGCGASDAFDGADAAAAADKTRTAGSSRYSYHLEMAGDPELGDEKVTIEGAGVFDYASGRGRMSLDMSELGKGSGLPASEFEGTMLLIGDFGYMHMPVFDTLGAKERWVLFEDAGSQLGDSSGGNDPQQMLGFLRAADGKLDRVGDERVRGVRTTHYRATIDLDRVLEVAVESERDKLEACIEVIKQMTGSSELPFEIWIDKAGYVRRTDMELKAQEGDEYFRERIEYFGFGVKVEVEEPALDDVMTEKELDELLEAPAPPA